MHRLAKLSLCALLLSPGAAMAAGQQPMGSVAVFATNTSLEVPAGTYDEDGTGFGVKGWMGFGVPFGHFEYQSTTVGDNPTPGEVDMDQWRIGGGTAIPASEPVLLLGKVEYVNLGLDDGSGSDLDLDGFGVHAGAMFIPGPAMHVGASVGYLMLSGDSAGFGDTDGIEFNVGAGFNFTKQWGAFIDYRTFMGSFDAAGPGVDDELTVTDVRVGGTFSWGM